MGFLFTVIYKREKHSSTPYISNIEFDHKFDVLFDFQYEIVKAYSNRIIVENFNKK